jgi:hypothetical protein
MFEKTSRTRVIEQPRWAWAFTANVVASLALLVVGYPLAPATIRAILLGGILGAAGLTRIIWGARSRVNKPAIVFKKR